MALELELHCQNCDDVHPVDELLVMRWFGESVAVCPECWPLLDDFRDLVGEGTK